MGSLESVAADAARELRRAEVFDGHAEALEELARRQVDETLVACVVGITSSGKSTFLNAIMGEPLLPEQAKATTNVMVECRRGQHRRLVVHHRDGRHVIHEGDSLDAALLLRLSSEDGNPGNRREIDRLEWASPSSVIPVGMSIRDTPGLDAHGFDHHGQLTLREYLPMAEVAIYLTSVRKPIGSSEAELFAKILENDQRILFVLTQADVVHDDVEGGYVFKTAGEKRRRSAEAMHQAIDKAGLSQASCGFAVVSSRLAVEARANRESDAWRASGFDPLLAELERLAGELRMTLFEERRHRQLGARLTKVDEDLRRAIENTAEEDDAEDDAATRKLQELQAQVASRVRELQEIWQPRLAPETVDTRALLRATTERELERAVDELSAAWARKLEQLNEALDEGRASLKRCLEEVDLSPSREQARRAAVSVSSFPSVHDHARVETHTHQTRGWFDSWKFWPESETRTHRTIDRGALREAVEAHVRELCRQAARHLTWWVDWMQGSLEPPVAAAIADARRAAQDRRRAREQAREMRGAKEAARIRIQELRGALGPLPVRVAVGKSSLFGDVEPSTARPAGPGAHHALIPLLGTFRELELATHFLQFLAARVELAAPERAAVLLLGRRDASIRLLASLFRDRALEARLGGVPGDRWIVVDADRRPVGAPWTSSATVVPPSERFPALRVAIAPIDEYIGVPVADWPTLLASFDAVGVTVDAPRIASGRAALERAPYRAALASAHRAFFVSDEGRSFDGQLHLLLTEVIPAAGGRRPWFVFDDYDARYTEMIALCEDVRKGGGTAEALARRWKAEELSFDPPFSHSALLQTFERIKVDVR